jgi:molybdopterin molybdotransferase
MILLPQAQALVRQQARSFGIQTILLEDAVQRVLAQPVTADRQYPPFNRATMDGIAISSSDWVAGIRQYEVAETIFAGQAYTQRITSGQCYKIMTGAAVPPGADTVIRREDIEADNNRLTVTVSHIAAGQNIAAAGSDIQPGAVVLPQNQLIKPGSITTLASLGYSQVSVYQLPTVAIITTGDEVVDISAAVNAVQIRNSNAALLKSLLRQWQIQPHSCAHVADDTTALTNAVTQVLHNDIIILSGAVSAGDADFVPAVLEQAGAQKIFHKVAIRPGKPFWFGAFKNGPVVFALPGNPFSTFVTYKLFIEDFLRHCFAMTASPMLQLPLNGSRVKKTGLDEFFPVTFTGSPTKAVPILFNSSGDITAVMQADALGWHEAAMNELANNSLVYILPI